jgi:hypothetical protein
MSSRVFKAMILVATAAELGLAQQHAPVASAFRDQAKMLFEKIIVAADALPAETYAFSPTPEQPRFGALITDFIWRSSASCSAIGQVDEPNLDLGAAPGKAKIVRNLRETAQFCEKALRSMDDSRLQEPIRLSLGIEVVTRTVPRPRAAAMAATLTYWADVYARAAQYLRLNGIVPPKPCGGVNNDTSCGSGRNLCQAYPNRGMSGLRFELIDAPSSTVRSDGLGPYVMGAGNVAGVLAGYTAVMVLGPADSSLVPRRSVSIDLTRPVAGDIGRSLGIVRDDRDLEIGTQWYADSTHRARSVLEIPIGTTVQAAQADVEFHIDGVVHSIQIGPQPGGHCFSDRTAIHGNGTSRATITRTDSTTWVIDVPPGSVGRLFDVHLSYPNAVDKGLYHVAYRYVLKK